MGIKATVIYDTPTHTPLVVRLPIFSLPHRYEIIDTISSFTAHCDSLRGVVRSVYQVSAQWGGPPYITYTVVGSRLRCIVIWEQSSSEFDLAFDVEACLHRLEKSVTPLVDQLAERDPVALGIAYDQAGYALTGELPIALNAIDMKKQKPKLLPRAPSLHRRSSIADPKKKKSLRLFGRLGSVLKGVAGGNEGTLEEDESHSMSESSLRPPSEAAAMSVAQYGSDNDASTEMPELQLPDEMFAWADFGVDGRPDDLSWLVQLMHGEDTVMPPSVPRLRAGSVSSTPLTIPMVESQVGADGSVTPSAESLAPKLPPTAQVKESASQDLRSSAGPKMIVSNEAGAMSRESSNTAPTTSTPVSTTSRPTPKSNTIPTSAASHSLEKAPGLLPNQGESLKHAVASGGIPIVQTPAVQHQTTAVAPRAPAAFHTNTPNVQGPPAVSGARPPIPLNSRASGPHNSTVMPSQTTSTIPQSQMNVGMHTLMNPHSHIGQPPVADMRTSGYASSVASSVPTGAQSPVPPSPMMRSTASSMENPPMAPPAPSGAEAASARRGSSGRNNIPPALAALQEESSFDVSAFGKLKDDAAVVVQGQTGEPLGLTGQSAVGSRAQREMEDEAIRTRMNEFAVSMQAGNFTLALQQVYATLKLLRQVQPRRERETITCANYVLAQKILIRNATLEKELQRVMAGSVEAMRRHIECALLTMFLAEMKHLLPRHRVAAMQVAVEKNLVVSNYGMCARWLRQLLEKAPERAKGELQSKLEGCMRAGESNAQLPVTNRLCYVTLQVLAVPYGKCNVCGAVYHAQMAGVVQGQVCPTCLVGGVEGQMV